MPDLAIGHFVGLAAEGGRRNGTRESPTIRLNRTSVLTTQTGLLALFSLFLAFSLFGPAFSYGVGFMLFTSALGLGLIAIVLAHRAAHAHRRDPYLVGGHYATFGRVTGWLAFLVGISYLGLWYAFLYPLVLPLLVPLGVVALVVHFDRTAREDSFRRSLNLAAGTAACGRCGWPIPLSLGRWRSEGWLCPKCDAYPRGVSA